MAIYARIDKNLEKKFRMKIIEVYGSRKGALEKALEDAITLWLEMVEKTRRYR